MSSNSGACDEDRLIRFMRDPANYPHAPESVRMIQTHASLVFVASPFVYKIKKPVDFGFLDFSTLEKRRYFCEQELRLNQRLCPEGYLEVVPVTMMDGRLQLSGEGEVVEVAVKMREFSEDGFFDRKVESGQVTTVDMDRIVALLAEFYSAQQPTPEMEEWGRVEKLRISTEENFVQTEAFVGRTISSAAFGAIRAFTRSIYESHAGLFEERVKQGWIRDCHGDLHLEHIHLTPAHLHIYDCIEFNHRFRWIDVASDAAFLAMDLDFRDRRDLSRYFVGKLADALKDNAMLRLLPFYQCYRAYVRGKVESFHSESPEAGEAERGRAAELAARYFRLALGYAVGGADPLLIAVMGRVASGKSTLAKRLGPELAWEVFSSDAIRKELAGLPLMERPDEATRQRIYTAEMSAMTYDRMTQRAIECASEKGGAILDATFSRRCHRETLAARAREAGIRVVFVWANADSSRRQERLAAREDASGVVSDARQEDRRMLDAGFEPPEVDEAERVVEVDSSADDPPVEAALLELAERSAASA